MNNIEVITVATHSQGLFEELINNKHNIKIKVLGYDKKWTGFRMKNELIYEYIKNLPDDDIIIFIDGFDTIINGDLEKAKDIFIKNNYKVLYSKDNPSFFVTPYLVYNFCKNKLTANTGLYMARIKYLKIILKKNLNDKCISDQRVLNKNCSLFDFIDIDEKEEIFKNTKNLNEKTNAVFIQYPGTKPSISIFTKLKFFIQTYLQFYIKWYLIFICFILIFNKKKNYNNYILLLLHLYLFYYLNIDLSCI